MATLTRRLLAVLLALIPAAAQAQQLTGRQWDMLERALVPNQFQGEDGTATLPTYSFRNSTTSGVWFDPTSTDFLTINGGNAPAGTDVAGKGILLKPGPGRGNASGGDVVMYCAPPAATGSGLNTQQAIFQYSCTGADAGRVTVGGIDKGTSPAGESAFLGVDVAAGVTDGVGGNTTVAAGRGTGAGSGGILQLAFAPADSSSGTTQNALQNVFSVQGGDGALVLGGHDIEGTPGLSTWAGADRASGITDGAGGSVTVRSGVGTGSAAASSLAFQTPTVGVSGTSQQALATRFTIATDALTATVPHLAANGSQSAPSYSFTNSTSSGLWINSSTHMLLTGNQASGSNQVGGRVDIRTGRGTGTGNGGNFNLYGTVPRATSDSTFHVEQPFVAFNGQTGAVTFGNVTVFSGASGLVSLVGVEQSGTTNVAGGNVILDAGEGTGNAAGSAVLLRTPTAGASGTTTQTLATRVTVDETGVAATVPITSTTNNLGWSVQSAANQACTTTCTSAAVFGIDTAAGAAMVGPTDATADVCLCAGAS